MAARALLVLLRGCLALALLAAAPAALAAARVCIDRDVLSFGNRAVGSSVSTTVAVSNCGNVPLAFTDVHVHPATGAGFQVGTTCASGTVLPAGAACTAQITFAPSFAGQQSGALVLEIESATSSVLVTFYGRGTTDAAGTSRLVFSPSAVQFPDTPMNGSSAVVRLELQNQGSVPITPTALVWNGPAAHDFFTVGGDCAVGSAIAVGSSCEIDVIFHPGGPGARIANLNVDAPELGSIGVLRVAGTATDQNVAPPSRPRAVDIVEFRNAALDHYFLTAEPGEIAFLDAGGLGPEWSRTGRRLQGWASATVVAGAIAACRFVGAPNIGPNSHFYTVDPGECTFVKSDPFWTYEGTVFRVLPVGAGGTCEPGATLVQRLFKPASDARDIRHRYVSGASDVDAMQRAGWLLEGGVWCSGGD